MTLFMQDDFIMIRFDDGTAQIRNVRGAELLKELNNLKDNEKLVLKFEIIDESENK